MTSSIEVPEGFKITMWCSLFCTGNEAVGDLTVEEAGGEISIPICEECRDKLASGLTYQ